MTDEEARQAKNTTHNGQPVVKPEVPDDRKPHEPGVPPGARQPGESDAEMLKRQQTEVKENKQA
jgi:hypothetical protein